MQRELDARMRLAERFNAPRARAQAAAMRAEPSAPCPGARRRRRCSGGICGSFHVIAALDNSSFTDVTLPRPRVRGNAPARVRRYDAQRIHRCPARASRRAFRPDALSHRRLGFRERVGCRRRRPDPRAVHASRERARPRAGLRNARGYASGCFNPNDVLLWTTPDRTRPKIFYGFVPDPGGIYSCAHDSLTVKSVIVDCVHARDAAHDLVQPARARARRRPGGDPGLNEGLRAMAVRVEMASKYYEAKFPAPLGRSAPRRRSFPIRRARSSSRSSSIRTSILETAAGALGDVVHRRWIHRGAGRVVAVPALG